MIPPCIRCGAPRESRDAGNYRLCNACKRHQRGENDRVEQARRRALKKFWWTRSQREGAAPVGYAIGQPGSIWR